MLDILDRADMSNCKPPITPMDTHSKLSANGVSVADPINYHSLTGALQYHTCTRPHIAKAVHQICMYMHDPREPHLGTLKHISWYLQGTLNLGLHLPHQLISLSTPMQIALAVLAHANPLRVMRCFSETILSPDRPTVSPQCLVQCIGGISSCCEWIRQSLLVTPTSTRASLSSPSRHNGLL